MYVSTSFSVEITAKYPEVWRIKQVFIHVPDNNPYVHRGRGNDYRYHKVVGHWAWNLLVSTKVMVMIMVMMMVMIMM